MTLAYSSSVCVEVVYPGSLKVVILLFLTFHQEGVLFDSLV